jgi:CheY-like chemotaxis protein
MPVVVLLEAPYARGGEVARRWARESGFHLVTTDEVLSAAERAYGCQRVKLERALTGSASVFNAFTHERERSVSCLRGATASLFSRDNWVYCGPAALLVPSSINIALRVCLVAPSAYRAKVAAEVNGISLAKADRLVARDDAQQAAWSGYVAESAPWNAELFDVVIPMHETGIDGAIALIGEHIGNPALTPTDGTAAAIADFRLAAAVHMTLAGHGHDVDVRCEHGYITVILNRYTVRLEHLEEEVKRLAKTVDGVKEVTTRVGARFRPPSQYVDLDADTPAKILLVDDEKEFVQTLSERLLARNVGTAVAFSGEEALAIIESDEPEVVVLDLQMPGIDGIEVLRRVKKGHPDTQVIILTGHGSDRERQLAAELGACAYLHKPVDINVLSRTMKDAYAAIRRARPGPGEPSERG